jgi:lipopolysaccharide export system permease protein
VVVVELLLLSLGHIFALTIPMAILVSTMMAFSQMVSENEITAMRSGGISLYRIIAAPLAAALLATLCMFLFNNYILPETNHRLKNLLVAVRSKKPALDIKPGRFIDDLPGYTLYVEGKDNASSELYDLLIFQRERGGNPSIISARRANFVKDEEQDLMKMALRYGEQFEASLESGRQFQITVFDRMDLLMPDIDSDMERRDQEHRGDREMSVAQMNDRVRRNREDLDRLDERMAQEARKQLEQMLALLIPQQRAGYLRGKGVEPAAAEAGAGVPSERRRPPLIRDEENTERALSNLVLSRDSVERKIRRYQVEIHKKYAIPFACLVFILLGAPMAIKTGRSGTGWGIAFSLSLFTIYYVFLVGGEELADREFLAPWLAMWAANLILLVFGTWMLFWTNRESRPFSLLTRIGEAWTFRRREA